MKRKLLGELIEWKEQQRDNHRKPVLITGSRAVGKTHLASTFAKAFFEDSIYINFERHTKLITLFCDKNPENVIRNIEQYFDKQFQVDSTILILDEISVCSDAIDFLIECSKNKLNYNIIVISSKPSRYITRWLDFKTTIYHLTLYPFDFEEYLWATGYEWYSEVIREHYNSNIRIPDIVHKELMDILEQYLIIGGMPRAINEYINSETLINISEQHHFMIESFCSDAVNHTDESTGLKIKNIINTMDLQIAKKNKKFQYKLIRKGASKSLYLDAINYMDASHILIKIQKLDSKHFKLYLNDVGMQLTLTNEHYKSIEYKNKLELRKGLIENYVAMNLNINHQLIFFWESSAQAKIDFVIMNRDKVTLLPIEVSIDGNTRTKSLSIFKDSYSISNSIKISTNNFGFKNNVKYVPLYAIFCI